MVLYSCILAPLLCTIYIPDMKIINVLYFCISYSWNIRRNESYQVSLNIFLLGCSHIHAAMKNMHPCNRGRYECCSTYYENVRPSKFYQMYICTYCHNKLCLPGYSLPSRAFMKEVFPVEYWPIINTWVQLLWWFCCYKRADCTPSV